jgi:Metallopeptidase toxin 3
MKLDADTIKNYPKFHYYVRVNMPEVAKVDSIINAIKKIAGKTSKTTIREAMKYGNNPLIKVVEDLKCAGDPALGCYRFGSDEIRVNKRLVDEFEAGRGIVETPGGKKVYLVGVTILHELTHWADAQDGVNATGEDGDAFETAVYGEVLDESDLV